MHASIEHTAVADPRTAAVRTHFVRKWRGNDRAVLQPSQTRSVSCLQGKDILSLVRRHAVCNSSPKLLEDTMRRRRGFTLIELLVVIPIIAVLVSLLLPAVQNAREAARRTQCRNNLKQLGVALHNYHTAHNVFPPGYVAGAAWPATTNGWSFYSQLLPYLDQSPLYEKINFNLPVEDPANQPVVGVILPALICPTDLIDGTFAITDATGNVIIPAAAPISYAATVGDDASEADGPTGNGTFYRNSRTRISDIIDGTSTTVLAGERAFGFTNGTWAGAPNNGLVRA